MRIKSFYKSMIHYKHGNDAKTSTISLLSIDELIFSIFFFLCKIMLPNLKKPIKVLSHHRSRY